MPTQPALLQLPWFAWGHAHWLQTNARLLLRVRAAWPWRATRVGRRAWQQRGQARHTR